MRTGNDRANLARVLGGQVAPWLSSELIERARAECVAALLERCLRSTGAATGSAYVALLGLTREQTAATMLRQAEIRRIAAALEQSRLPALLLKGNALSLWLYPEPQLRESGDIDLWFCNEGDLQSAIEVFHGLGYQFDGGQRSTHYEITGRLLRGGRKVAEVDLHSRLVNSPLFAARLRFDELWASGGALLGGHSVRYLSPTHAVLHAAMHRAVDLSNGSPDCLKWLYDFHLFAAHMTPDEWDETHALAGQRGLAGVLLRSLLDTQATFETLFPAGVLERLAHLAAAESLQYHRLDDWWYVQRQTLAATPGMAGKVRWVAHRLLPTRSQMAALYGREYSWWALVLLRLKRGWARAIGRPGRFQ